MRDSGNRGAQAGRGLGGDLHSLNAVSAPFLIGGQLVGQDLYSTCDGLVDEVRIWNSALDDDQVEFFFDHPAERNDVLCGDANASGRILAADALTVLAAAVGSTSCQHCICDVNGTSTVTAGDALRVLRSAVGQDVELACTVCGVVMPAVSQAWD